MTYTQLYHFKQKLEAFRSNENEIPLYVFQCIEHELKTKYPEIQVPTQKLIICILHDIGATCYYDMSQQIAERIRFQFTINANTIIQDINECPVCLEESDTFVKLQCHHMLCVICATKLNDMQCTFKCPMCRNEQPKFIKPTIILTSEQYDLLSDHFVHQYM